MSEKLPEKCYSTQNLGTLGLEKIPHGCRIYLNEWYPNTNVGGQLLIYDKNSTSSIDGGSVFAGFEGNTESVLSGDTDVGVGRYIRKDNKNHTFEQWGMLPDGSFDNFFRFRALRDFVVSQGGHVEITAEGNSNIGTTYYFGQIRDLNNPETKDPIFWENCNGLVFDLCGCKIDIKGDFNRGQDIPRPNGDFQSFLNGFSPFLFRRCNYVVIKNGEIDGNVDQMTASDRNVNEGFNSCIRLFGCRHVEIKKLHIHHFPTDGIGVDQDGGDPNNPFLSGINTEYCTVENCLIDSCGRNNLSVLGARHLSVKNTKFAKAGITDGSYFGHSPRANVDIEPDVVPDQLTDLIVFENCEFINGAGNNVASGRVDTINHVRITQCRFIHEPDPSDDLSIQVSLASLYLTSRRFVLEDNYFLNHSLRPISNSKNPNNERVEVILRNNIIESNNSNVPLLAVVTTEPYIVDIRDNKFIIDGDTPFPSSTDYNISFSVMNGDASFSNNLIHIKTDNVHDNSLGDNLDHFATFRIKYFERNKWKTDGALKWYVEYIKSTTEPDGVADAQLADPALFTIVAK